MLNVGAPEIMVILLVALLFLGPQRLPEAARQVGKALGEFRRVSGGLQAEVRDAFAEPLNAFQESLTSAETRAPSATSPSSEETADEPAADASEQGSEDAPEHGSSLDGPEPTPGLAAEPAVKPPVVAGPIVVPSLRDEPSADISTAPSPEPEPPGPSIFGSTLSVPSSGDTAEA